MDFQTTEVTSTDIIYEKPIHNRLYFGYITAQNYIYGDVLELGCGVGRGTEALQSKSNSYTAIDKNESLTQSLSKKYPNSTFITLNMPPFSSIKDESYDCVVSFHVIEHIKNDALFLSEISRVLKPNGLALISTPNKPKSFARNPWHIREYTKDSLSNLAKPHFSSIEIKGISGNKKVEKYMQKNKQNVDKIMRFDVFNLQWLLPAVFLQVPYEILNKRNRKKLMNTPDALASEIEVSDYFLSDDITNSWDLFAVLKK